MQVWLTRHGGFLGGLSWHGRPQRTSVRSVSSATRAALSGRGGGFCHCDSHNLSQLLRIYSLRDTGLREPCEDIYQTANNNRLNSRLVTGCPISGWGHGLPDVLNQVASISVPFKTGLYSAHPAISPPGCPTSLNWDTPHVS
jgi:hypothetical protein